MLLWATLGHGAPQEKPRPATGVEEPVLGRWEWPADRKPAADAAARLKAPPGFRVEVFASELENPRVLLTLPDGSVLVSRPERNDVLSLRDRDGDGRADEVRTAAMALPMVHGLAYRDQRVYMAGPTTLWSAELRADGTLGPPAVVVSDLPEGGQHPNRTLAFGPDGLLYISVGSDCNDCNETNPEHATMVRMRPDGSQRGVFARGLRNTVGFGWHPQTRELWGLDHGTDWRGDEIPPEELNHLQEGGHYGWPFCWGRRAVDDTRKDPEGTTLAKFCAASQPSVLELPAHAAPMAMAFYDGAQFPPEYRGDALAALRGSWNRGAPRKPKLVRLRFREGRPAGVEDFVTGFQSADGRTRWGRLVGVAVAGDGSLLFSDDEGGVVYRVSHGPRASAGSSPGKPPATPKGAPVLARLASLAGFAAPESVLHDPDQDVYFVSNVGGEPTARDGNGFISRVSPEGGVETAHFAGAPSGSALHAPKGMALVGDALWVTDIDAVKAFDRRTGKALRTVDLKPRGAVFLNDLAATPEGELYVSDSGLVAKGPGVLEHVGPDRIFKVDREGAASVAVEGPLLEAPNGLAWDAEGRRLLIVTGKGRHVLSWSPGAREPRRLASGPGAFDGLVAVGPSQWIVSSHQDQGLYLLREGRLQQLVRTPPRPADLGFDRKRGRLLVPSLDGDWVALWQLPFAPEPAQAALEPPR